MKKIYYKIIFLLTASTVLYLATSNSDTVLFDHPHEDKILHMMAFFTLSLLLNRSSSLYHARVRNMLALLLFGIFIEVAQLFLPYRSAETYDVIADLGGILTFQLLLSLYRYYKQMLTPAIGDYQPLEE